MTVEEILEKDMLSLTMEDVEAKYEPPLHSVYDGIDPLMLRLLSDLGLGGNHAEVTQEEMQKAWTSAGEVDHLVKIDARYRSKLVPLSRDGDSMRAVRNALRTLLANECGVTVQRERRRTNGKRSCVFVVRKVQ
jgi:hypothetical protein